MYTYIYIYIYIYIYNRAVLIILIMFYIISLVFSLYLKICTYWAPSSPLNILFYYWIYSPQCTFNPCDSFVSWTLSLLTLSIYFTQPLTHLLLRRTFLFLCIYDSVSVLLCLFHFSDFTYKWNHTIFLPLSNLLYLA